MPDERQSTSQDLKDFVAGPVWADFKRTLDARLEALTLDTEQLGAGLDPSSIALKLAEVNGEKRGLKFWLMLPETILRNEEVDAEWERMNRENG